MPLNERIEGAGRVIKTVGVLISLLPGAAVLIGLIQLPGNMAALIKFLSGALAVIVVLAILLCSAAVRRLKGPIAAALVLGFGVGGAIASTAYMIYADHHLLPSPDGAGALVAIPDVNSPELELLMKPYDGDYSEALMTSSQRDKIRRLMGRDSSGSIFRMVGLLLAGQLSLVFAIALAAWKLAERDGAARRRRATSAAG